MYEVFVKVLGERGEWVVVGNSREASRAVRACIEASGIGVGEWRGGDVRDAVTRRKMARVAYNGRVWDRRPYPKCVEIIF